MTSFADLGLDPSLVETLRRMDISEPTPIQAAAIPELVAGRDVVGQARTGSGKTLAFALPLMQTCDPKLAAPQALVLVPTRELAGQVSRVVDQLTPRQGLRAAQIYGGRDMAAQLDLLRTNPHIVIGTPGRLLDHLYRGTLALRHLRCLVLDEADQMLDVGFGPDVDRILDTMLHKPQIALFSATMPDWVHQVIQHRLNDPAIVSVDETGGAPTDTVEHTVIEVPASKKLEALRSLLDEQGRGEILIFARTKIGVERLERQLTDMGYRVAALQGNLGQAQRERVLRGFRRGNPRILVATNVAARGLDILSIEQVINFDVPENAELLTHRIGRTGRMGRTGEAVTILTPADKGKWRIIERQLGVQIRRVEWGQDMPEPDKPAPAREERPRGQEARRRPSGRRSGSRERHQVTCAECGKDTTVNFQPRADRPVYCAECYRERKTTSAA